MRAASTDELEFFNVQRWTEMPEGGHFAALETPDLLVNDIREFFRPLRAAGIRSDDATRTSQQPSLRRNGLPHSAV